MTYQQRANIIRERFKACFGVSAAWRPRARRPVHESKRLGFSLINRGNSADTQQPKWVRECDARGVPVPQPKRTARVSALTRIALRADKPIPGCRHSRPVQRFTHGKA